MIPTVESAGDCTGVALKYAEILGSGNFLTYHYQALDDEGSFTGPDGVAVDGGERYNLSLGTSTIIHATALYTVEVIDDWIPEDVADELVVLDRADGSQNLKIICGVDPDSIPSDPSDLPSCEDIKASTEGLPQVVAIQCVAGG